MANRPLEKKTYFDWLIRKFIQENVEVVDRPTLENNSHTLKQPIMYDIHFIEFSLEAFQLIKQNYTQHA